MIAGYGTSKLVLPQHIYLVMYGGHRPSRNKRTSDRTEFWVHASVDCGFGDRLLSGSQHSTSGSVRILYTSRQSSWSGKALLGTSEKFHCVAVSGGERQGNAGCWAPVQGHVHIGSAIEKISCLNSLVTSVTDFYLMPGEIKNSTTK